jgi:Mat/Ecp fimbriae major subunit
VTDTSHFISRLAVLALLGMVPMGQAQAAQTTISASAKVVKSLELSSKQNLDFGTITMSGATGTYTVSLSMTGVLTCPSGATCAGAPLPAILNAQGSQGQVVRITVAPSNLVNSVDNSTIPFTPIAPASITLTNSGFPGKDFNLGGSIAIPSTADGTYTGNIVVTADYQ